MKTQLIILSFLFITATLCRAQERSYTETDTEISVTAGETFDIKVVSNRTTGYMWVVGEISDGAQVVIVSSEYAAPESGMMGASGIETWKFKAVSSGSVKLVWSYVKPWEQAGAPAKTITFNVTVN